MSYVLRLTSSRLASLVSRPRLSRSRDTSRETRGFAFAFALALLTSYFSLLISSAQAEDWGFSYSGQILEVVGGVKRVARYTDAAKGYSDATDYDADVFIRLYDESESAKTAKTQALWGRKIHVSAKNGSFSCELRDSAGEVLAAAYTNLQDAVSHLEGSTVTVGVTPFADTNAEIDPRQMLSSVPFAVNAGDALGANGDITISGSLKTGAAEAPTVTFAGPVTHAGTVTFGTDPEFPSLTFADGEPLIANRLAVETDVSVTKLSADRLAAVEAKVTVKGISSGAVSNLTVNGAATFAEATGDAGRLTVDGDVSVEHTLRMKNIVLGAGADLFRWDGNIVTMGSSSSEAQSRYTVDGSGGHWTVPESITGHLLMSLNYQLNANGSVTVKLDGKTVGTLSSSGGGWMSLQVIVPPGKKIEWSSKNVSSTVVRYRKFRY